MLQWTDYAPMFHSYLIIHENEPIRQKLISQTLSNFKIHSVDLHTFDTETIGIAQVKQLLTVLGRRPFASSHKAAIIDGSLLTIEAQNALLKTLEEPTEQTIILIHAPQTDSLLPTIQSRCVILSADVLVQAISDEEIAKLIEWWKLFLSKSIGERMKETEKFKDRDEAKKWIETQIIFFQKLLKDFYTKDNKELFKKDTQLNLSLKLLLKTYEYLEQNLNVKLTLDNLFIGLPRTT